MLYFFLNETLLLYLLELTQELFITKSKQQIINFEDKEKFYLNKKNRKALLCWTYNDLFHANDYEDKGEGDAFECFTFPATSDINIRGIEIRGNCRNDEHL